MKFVRVPKNQEINKQTSRTKKSKASPAETSALAAMHMDLDTKKWAKSILQQNGRSGDDVSIEKLMDRCNEIWYVQQHRLETRIKRRIGRLGYEKFINRKSPTGKPVLLPRGKPLERLAEVRKQAVTEALKECLRTGASGGSRIEVQLTKTPSLVQYKSCSGENRDVYGGAYKGWAATVDIHRLTVPEDWRVRVLKKGLDTAGGMLTLDAHPLERHGDIELFEAVWVQQGRGYSGTMHRGVIARFDGEVFHGENIEAAIKGVSRKVRARTPSQPKGPYHISIQQFVKRYSKYNHEVSIADAVDSGSCEYGILSWCHTVGIDPEDDAVPMSRILEAFQQSPRIEVRRAVLHSVKRNRRTLQKSL
ncbi:hypothetical protein QF021_002843 [Acidovorax delafieldii]|uniref:hypothetical protein n=1 Tax=Acidovorax delafieldii TaxID=47920 RepID=UPI00286642E7|nr:hypothetical protein [Acidovorax delafieldii]MDR6154754.1 hypothetical protein [Acidovorax delafieldii]